jgi:hypothetical protein
MSDFLRLLRDNRNYRSTWAGQVVSEVGDLSTTLRCSAWRSITPDRAWW